MADSRRSSRLPAADDAARRADRALDPVVAERLAQLSLTAAKAVEGFLSGRHRSPHRGVSVEFVERRPYVQGDDLRHLDWKAFARNDRLAIKRYEEETTFDATLVVDASASMGYPTDGGDSKYDVACRAAAAIAHLVLRERDGVSLALFDHRLDRVLPASTSPAHLGAVLRALVERNPDGTTDLGEVLARLVARVPRPGVVVVLSDLLGDEGHVARGLGHLVARRHDAIVLHVLHTDELRFPFDRLTRFDGIEEPGRLLVDAPALRAGYLEALERWLARMRRTAGALGVDYRLLETGAPLDVALSAWLAARELRTGRRG